jgi:hypothetical protein
MPVKGVQQAGSKVKHVAVIEMDFRSRKIQHVLQHTLCYSFDTLL